MKQTKLIPNQLLSQHDVRRVRYVLHFKIQGNLKTILNHNKIKTKNNSCWHEKCSKLVNLTGYSWNSTWCILVAVVTFLLQFISRNLLYKTWFRHPERYTHRYFTNDLCTAWNDNPFRTLYCLHKIVWLSNKWIKLPFLPVILFIPFKRLTYFH